jgi:phosphoglycerol transferase MdoB-like AlkP superfamily enzyme
VIQQIDIMPSVLSYLNYNEPFLAFGENVFLQKRKNIAINYYNGFQMIDGDYLLQMNGNIPASLFNYVEDPILKYNLIDKMPLKKDSMKTTLLAFRQQYHNRLIENRMTVK